MLSEDTDRHCPVHGVELKEGRVLIKYGLFRYSPEYHAAKRRLFPYSRFVVLGGCMVGTDAYHNVKFCEVCRNEHRSWCESNGANYDLPLSTEEEDQYLLRIFGNSDFSGTVPPEVADLLSQGEVIKAVKALKASNPTVDISLLRAHVTYLQRKERT